MIRRSLLIALTLVVVVASPAAAGDDRSASLTGTTLGDGYVEIAGTGCEPHTRVNATVTEVTPFSGISASSSPTVAEGEADDDGGFELRTFVGDEPGNYLNTVTCGDLVQTLGVQVGEETLPRTGAESSVPLARLGVVLMTTGAIAVYAARRRRRPLVRT